MAEREREAAVEKAAGLQLTSPLTEAAKVAKARVGQLEETVQSLLAELDEAQKAAGAR